MPRWAKIKVCHYFIFLIKKYSSIISQSLGDCFSHLRHLHCGHSVDVKAEDLGSIVTHDKALQFLLVHWEAAGLDVQISAARETQHVLTPSVPRHAVGIGLLQNQDNIGAACESIRAHVQFRLKLIGWGGGGQRTLSESGA